VATWEEAACRCRCRAPQAEEFRAGSEVFWLLPGRPRTPRSHRLRVRHSASLPRVALCASAHVLRLSMCIGDASTARPLYLASSTGLAAWEDAVIVEGGTGCARATYVRVWLSARQPSSALSRPGRATRHSVVLPEASGAGSRLSVVLCKGARDGVCAQALPESGRFPAGSLGPYQAAEAGGVARARQARCLLAGLDLGTVRRSV
jgi:hypothetical protein